MQKRELMRIIQREMGPNPPSLSIIEQVVDATFAAIADALRHHDTVSIKNFGSFKAEFRDERTVNNPKASGTMHIPAKFVPKFTASSTLKEALKG